MNNKEKAIATLTITGIGAVTVAGVVEYMKVLRVERSKRKKIEAWERENLACIEKFRQRMTDVCNTVPFDSNAFWAAWREEQAFLNIVGNQPMY